MPCRSSLASISLRPRESRERCLRPSGASGGVIGLLGFGAALAAIGRGDDGARPSGGSAEPEGAGFAARAFLRSGLTWRATLSHSVRSSSLKWRLRGGVEDSGIEEDGGRFIGGGGGAAHGYGAAREAARPSAAPPATARSWPRWPPSARRSGSRPTKPSS